MSRADVPKVHYMWRSADGYHVYARIDCHKEYSYAFERTVEITGERSALMAHLRRVKADWEAQTPTDPTARALWLLRQLTAEMARAEQQVRRGAEHWVSGAEREPLDEALRYESRLDDRHSALVDALKFTLPEALAMWQRECINEAVEMYQAERLGRTK